jgi:hypothetical protein
MTFPARHLVQAPGRRVCLEAEVAPSLRRRVILESEEDPHSARSVRTFLSCSAAIGADTSWAITAGDTCRGRGEDIDSVKDLSEDWDEARVDWRIQIRTGLRVVPIGCPRQVEGWSNWVSPPHTGLGVD